MVAEKPVPIRWFPWIAFVPLWIFSAWSYYSIMKLRKGLLAIAGAWGISIGLQIVFPFPWGLGIALGVAPLPIFFTLKKWGNEWNENFKGYPQGRF